MKIFKNIKNSLSEISSFSVENGQAFIQGFPLFPTPSRVRVGERLFQEYSWGKSATSGNYLIEIEEKGGDNEQAPFFS
ncbi:MAG: hypothetical protein RBR08_15160 [Desulforegulaceae bacterium]|nr:hypothetical protein [Desulforegulaceae bacterium]